MSPCGSGHSSLCHCVHDNEIECTSRIWPPVTGLDAGALESIFDTCHS